MSICNTQVYKSPYGGWCASSRIHAPFIFDNAILVFNTMKRFGGMVTTVARIERKEKGTVFFYPYQDYHAEANTSDCRATEKAVKQLHDDALGKYQEIVSQAIEFYAKKGAFV